MDTRTLCTISFHKALGYGERTKLGSAIDALGLGGAVITFEDKPLYTYTIEHDPNNEGPRVENENLGVMHCAHQRYTLGDKGVDTPFVDDDYRAGVLRADILVCKPIYMYDHGGITISHGEFSCSWDSGLLGWHYMTRSVAEENWPNTTGDELIASVENCLKAELEEYDDFLQGNVFGFQVLDADGDEYEAGWGFIGSNIETNGMLDNVGTEHHAGLRAAWEKRYE